MSIPHAESWLESSDDASADAPAAESGATAASASRVCPHCTVKPSSASATTPNPNPNRDLTNNCPPVRSSRQACEWRATTTREHTTAARLTFEVTVARDRSGAPERRWRGLATVAALVAATACGQSSSDATDAEPDAPSDAASEVAMADACDHDADRFCVCSGTPPLSGGVHSTCCSGAPCQGWCENGQCKCGNIAGGCQNLVCCGDADAGLVKCGGYGVCLPNQ